MSGVYRAWGLYEVVADGKRFWGYRSGPLDEHDVKDGKLLAESLTMSSPVGKFKTQIVHPVIIPLLRLGTFMPVSHGARAERASNSIAAPSPLAGFAICRLPVPRYSHSG
jgi:hypothetical protein